MRLDHLQHLKPRYLSRSCAVDSTCPMLLQSLRSTLNKRQLHQTIPSLKPVFGATGIHKTKYWDPVYEDSMNLLGKLPGIAATIYNNTYRGGKQIPTDPSLDWAANLAVMMGQDKSSVASLDMMRMYQTIHAGMHPHAPWLVSCAVALCQR